MDERKMQQQNKNGNLFIPIGDKLLQSFYAQSEVQEFVCETSQNETKQKKKTTTNIPIVDLTKEDDGIMELSQNRENVENYCCNLLFLKCHLCGEEYSNAESLKNHWKTYHNVTKYPEHGMPLIDLNQPDVKNKLMSLGITNYIPINLDDMAISQTLFTILDVNNLNLKARDATSTVCALRREACTDAKKQRK